MPAGDALHSVRSVGERSQPWVALHTPEQFPEGPWPRHVPPPRPSESRPDPCALWPPVRDAHADLAGRRDPARDADVPATQIGYVAAADHHAVAIGLVAGSALGDDKHAPRAVERRRIRRWGGRKNRHGENARQRGDTDGMADHWDPRVSLGRLCRSAAPGLWSLCLFFIMGTAIVGLAHNAVRMVSRRRAAKEGALPSIHAAEMGTESPPQDHVIIVFDEDQPPSRATAPG